MGVRVMGSTRMMVVLSVLLPACVQRGVDGPIIGLGGGEPATAGKDSSPDMPEPEPESESESEDSETTGATSPKDPPETDGADASSGESSSGAPADASTTDDDPPDDDSTGGPPMVPTGDPMWWHCSDDADCESGVCVVVQVAGEAADGFCSDLCNDAWSDCDAPDSGTAQPVCVPASVSVCGLDCTSPATCPDGMGCIMVAESPVPICV